MSLFKTILTEDKANSVWCPLRLAFIIGFVVLIGLELYSTIWQGREFKVLEFGGALGTYLTATGAGLWFNSKQVDS